MTGRTQSEFGILPDKTGEVLAVIGSRGYGSANDVRYAMDAYLGGVIRVVSGGARGVDRDAEEYAVARGLGTVSYRPRKTERGYMVDKWVNGSNLGPVQHPKTDEPWLFTDFRSAALRRNWWIVRDSTRVLALWDGDSTGTAHGIAAASRFGRELRIWMDGDS